MPDADARRWELVNARQSAENDVAERQRVERVIREALPSLLVSEYGETEADWRELRSVRRIAADLAVRVIPPAVSDGEQP